MVNHSTAKPDDVAEAPPPVEGRVPTAQEMEVKGANGRYYLDNLWRICAEYPTHDVYECRADLEGLVNKLYTQVRDLGYMLSDESARLDGVKNCLELAEAWAKLCRDARTSEKMFVVRRTPQNSGAMLMVQRLEHLRGQVTEMAPLAYIAIVRDDQLLVTRDRVMEQDATERVLIEFAKQREDCAICMEFIRARQSMAFACGHQIHSDCYEQFVKAGAQKCPACSMPVEAKLHSMQMSEGGTHERLVAAAKPPPPVVEPLPQAQRPFTMSNEMFDKQIETVRGLMAKLNNDDAEEIVLQGVDAGAVKADASATDPALAPV